MSEEKSYMGFSFGIGAELMLGKPKSSGLDFDIIYIETGRFHRDVKKFLNKGYDVEEKYSSRVVFSFGWRHMLESG